MISRPIKFRAWDKEERKMILSEKIPYQYMFEYEGDGIKCCRNDSYCDSFGDEHDSWTTLDNIMQFTGLPDKNGKEIYEGDIVKTFNGELAEIRYGEYQDQSIIDMDQEYYLDGHDERNDVGFYARVVDGSCHGLDNTPHKWIEVIGNIYENPELLEQP